MNLQKTIGEYLVDDFTNLLHMIYIFRWDFLDNYSSLTYSVILYSPS